MPGDGGTSGFSRDSAFVLRAASTALSVPRAGGADLYVALTPSLSAYAPPAPLPEGEGRKTLASPSQTPSPPAPLPEGEGRKTPAPPSPSGRGELDAQRLAGGVQAVVFDWAGTVLDFGSRAPVEAFRRAFASAGVDVSEAEARAPMGLPKAEHLRVMGTMPRVAGAWRAVHGVTFGEADVQRLLEAFVPVQAMVIREHADLVPGAAPVVAALRARGIKIGSTTGYPRAVMGDLRVLAAAQGFDPDAVTCGDDLPETRPSPLGFWRCLIELGAWPACACVKVDDTVPGLMEGRNAGAWTVAVLASGNAAGIDARTWDSLTEGDRNLVRARARASLSEATPDFMIDTVADLLPVVDEISKHGSQRRSHPTHTPSER